MDILLIDGDVPPQEDFRRALALRLPVQVLRLPAGVDSLDFIRPFASGISDIRIHAASLRDASAIEAMVNLEGLTVDSEYAVPPVDVSGLSSLRSYEGPFDFAAGITTLASLRRLALVLQDLRGFSAIEAPIEELAVVLPRNCRNVPVIRSPKNVRKLSIADAATLSLNGLTAYENLETLDIGRVRSLSDVAVLTALPRLEQVSLVDVGRLDDLESVGRLPAVVEVRGGVGRLPAWSEHFPNVRVLE